ncbi:MAG: methylated-DNA--[protein]-cysteine S-methyltransferase [Proteobacteria bacterium]|nr:methylated-DNA--[protein]-cysteine S-methyltransferase [Pseudomonadota bacterium]
MEANQNNSVNDIITTPFGFSLSVFYSDKGIIGIEFLREKEEKLCKHNFKNVTNKLIEYFNGERVSFDDIPVVLKNLSNFEIKVLNACRQIPYGCVVTYKELAKNIGNERAFRAVGNTLGKNPIPIIIPCHRVIGSDGKLHGFTGGLDIKKTLLTLEKSL